jgi:hypothetical protein
LAELIHKIDILLSDIGGFDLLSQLLFLGEHRLEAGTSVFIAVIALFASLFYFSLLRVKILIFRPLIYLHIFNRRLRVLLVLNLLLLHCQLCELVLAVDYLVDRIWI